MSSGNEILIPPTAPTRLRQIALIAEDLERAAYLLVCGLFVLVSFVHLPYCLQTTILGTEVVFVDPQVAQWGLKNILGRPLAVSLMFCECSSRHVSSDQSLSGAISLKSAPPSSQTPRSEDCLRREVMADT